MIQPIRNVQIEQENPNWITSPWTLRKSFALVLWWIMCLLLPPFAIIAGAIVGLIYGCASGMLRGLVESYIELRRWWDMFVNSEETK